MYRKLLLIAHPSSTGWDWTGSARPSRPASVRWRSSGTKFAGGFYIRSSPARSATRRCPRARACACMYGGTGIGINGVADANAQRRPGCSSVVGDLPRYPARRTSSSRSAAACSTRASIYELPEVQAAKNPPLDMPNVLHHRRRVRGLEGREHRLASEDRGLERVRHRDLHAAFEDAPRASRTRSSARACLGLGSSARSTGLRPEGADGRCDGRGAGSDTSARAGAPAWPELRGQDARAGAGGAGRDLDLPLHLHHPHEPLDGRAHRRDLARLRRAGQLDAAVHGQRRVGLVGPLGRLLRAHGRARR